jgi:hypothetical protein
MPPLLANRLSVILFFGRKVEAGERKNIFNVNIAIILSTLLCHLYMGTLYMWKYSKKVLLHE